MINLLIGTIGSGKSLYSRQAAKDGDIIINDDAIVTAIHGDYTKYDQQMKTLYKAIETSILTHGLAMNKTIVVDKGLLLTSDSRKRWLGLASSFDVPALGICFPFSLPEVHADRRVAHDDRGYDQEYWTEVARHHQEIYEEPTLDEGFSSLYDAHYVDGEILLYAHGSMKCSNRFY